MKAQLFVLMVAIIAGGSLASATLTGGNVSDATSVKPQVSSWGGDPKMNPSSANNNPADCPFRHTTNGLVIPHQIAFAGAPDNNNPIIYKAAPPTR